MWVKTLADAVSRAGDSGAIRGGLTGFSAVTGAVFFGLAALAGDFEGGAFLAFEAVEVLPVGLVDLKVIAGDSSLGRNKVWENFRSEF
ncbi:hypothetical protein CCP4SC76_3010042 [Gammaproteobacteria bacterium]